MDKLRAGDGALEEQACRQGERYDPGERKGTRLVPLRLVHVPESAR